MHSRKVLLFSVANSTLSSDRSRSSAEERCFERSRPASSRNHFRCTSQQIGLESPAERPKTLLQYWTSLQSPCTYLQTVCVSSCVVLFKKRSPSIVLTAVILHSLRLTKNP